MTVEVFLMLLAIFATITSFVTEGTKKSLEMFGVKYASNIVVLCVSIIVGGLGTVMYYAIFGYTWNEINVLSIFLMIGANWLGSMIGYDKVTQAVMQIKNKQVM